MAHIRSGRWYLPGGEEPSACSAEVCRALRELNGPALTDPQRSAELLREIFPQGELPEVFAPLYVELGANTEFGPGCFLNFNCVILDLADINIGARTLFGPGCQLITVEHPVTDHARRAQGWERARPITIGEDCWFGAGAMVMLGVSIGDRVVVAAGSVVTRDVPSDTLVAGVPAARKRELIDVPPAPNAQQQTTPRPRRAWPPPTSTGRAEAPAPSRGLPP